MDTNTVTVPILEANVTTSIALSGSSSSLNSVQKTTIALYTTIGLIGVIGNAFVVVVFMSSKQLRSRHVIKLLINQSIIDFAGSIFLIAGSEIQYQSSKSYEGFSGEFYCRY